MKKIHTLACASLIALMLVCGGCAAPAEEADGATSDLAQSRPPLVEEEQCIANLVENGRRQFAAQLERRATTSYAPDVDASARAFADTLRDPEAPIAPMLNARCGPRPPRASGEGTSGVREIHAREARLCAQVATVSFARRAFSLPPESAIPRTPEVEAALSTFQDPEGSLWPVLFHGASHRPCGR